MCDLNGRLIDKKRIENIPTLAGEFEWRIKGNPAPGEYYIFMQQKGKNVASCKLIKL